MTGIRELRQGEVKRGEGNNPLKPGEGEGARAREWGKFHRDLNKR